MATEQTTQEWIEQRYGRVSVKQVTLYVALVPVMGGLASGEGMTEAAAMESLYKDLTNCGLLNATPQKAS